ncbi:MAG: hypothetical protein FJ284_14480 [Planctomycetes bacterium]|nr:hypothetical protein [Planctomycetota bacterium]
MCCVRFFIGLWSAITATGEVAASDRVTSRAAEVPEARQAAVGLDAEVQATWTRLPLRDWANRATTLAGKPVVLDRRVDPQVLVTLKADGMPLREVLTKVAATADAAVDELAGSVRIVPATAASRARRADQDRSARVAALPPGPRATVSARRPWHWPAAARPRDLVVTAAAEAGVEVSGVDSIPHDHFPPADLSPLSLAERLDLVLAHFDRRVVWESRAGKATGRIVAIDAELTDLAVPIAQPRPPRPRPGHRTVTVRDEFTLRLEAPLDQALAAISDRLGLALDLDAAGLAGRGIAPGEIVRAAVEKASREELLDAIVHPLGLAWRIEGDRLRVFPAPPSP